ncbi:hypothetical protein D3C87_258590 [compost metagenome]
MPGRIRLSLLATTTALVLAGCGAGSESAPTASAPTPDAPAATSPASAAAAEQAAPQAATAAAPSAQSVLTAISDIDGGGALSYDVENGSKIHYWHGQQFEAGGKQYYTGFAWITPHKYGADRQTGRIDPAAKVTLAHATFVADGDRAWTLQGSEPFIGEFGQAEQGNAIDTSRKPQTFTTASGRVLLALPSRAGTGDAGAPAYEVLVFNPHELQGTEERKWTFLGTVAAGTAGATAAPLELVAVDGSDLPALRVKTAGGDKATEYRYDPGHNTYRPISR